VSRRLAIATIPGDGIGPEVIDAAIPAIERAAGLEDAAIEWEPLPYGADHFLGTGETLPDHAFEHLRSNVDAILVGALGDPRVPGSEHARDILLGLRFRLDLYVNFRPCRLLHPDLCPLKDRADGEARNIDFVIFRENTEGVYLGRGTSRDVDTADSARANARHDERQVECRTRPPPVAASVRRGRGTAPRHRARAPLRGRSRHGAGAGSRAVPGDRHEQPVR
jgi:3-isopropylmalate dehydrogenase